MAEEPEEDITGTKMQQRHIYLHAANAEEFKALAKAANADQWHCAPAPSGRVVGHLVGGDRFAIRQQPNAKILPHPHSPADVSSHAKDLGVQNAKSAYDLFAALFQYTNWDKLDPEV